MKRYNQNFEHHASPHGSPEPKNTAENRVTDLNISAHYILPEASFSEHDRDYTATISQKSVFNGMDNSPTFILLIVLEDKIGSNDL